MFEDNTCFAYAKYEFGQRIRIGVIGPEDYYIMLTSAGIADLAAVNGFPIVAQFDNNEKYQGKANVSVLENGELVLEFWIGSHMLGSFVVAQNMYILRASRTAAGNSSLRWT